MSVKEIRDWYRARPGYWFRPKLLGFGVVPVTWQGWLLTLGVIVLAVPVARLAAARGPAYLVLEVPLLLLFLWVSWLKTDGDWRWRWGLGGDAR